jgi:hypothetical protein
MRKNLTKAALGAACVLLAYSSSWAEEQCCCNIICKYETIFGAEKNIEVSQCFDVGFGSGKVTSCNEDDACISVRQLGWIYLNEWEGSGCRLQDDCPAIALLGHESPEIDRLRQFRDEVLSKTAVGRQMIKVFYRTGPALIHAMEKNVALKNYVHSMLNAALLVLPE